MSLLVCPICLDNIKVELTTLDLLAVLREQGSRRHGEVLEWIGKDSYDLERPGADQV